MEQGPLRLGVTAIALQRAEFRSHGVRATHEDLVGLPRLQACVSSGVLGSTRKAPGNIELSVSCPEHSSHIILLKRASPSAVHATPRIALVPVIKLLSLSSKLRPSTPGSMTPGGLLTTPFPLWVPIRLCLKGVLQRDGEAEGRRRDLPLYTSCFNHPSLPSSTQQC